MPAGLSRRVKTYATPPGASLKAEAMEREAQTAVDRFKSEALNDFDAGYCQLHLANSADDEVRNTANAPLVERYTLSRIYSKQENGNRAWPSSMCLCRVLFLSCAMPFCRICWRIGAACCLESGLKADEALEIMKKIGEYKELQRELVKILASVSYCRVPRKLLP